MSSYPADLYGGKPPHVGGTSEEAANTMREPAQSIRHRVFGYVSQYGSYGATDEQIELALRVRHQTVSARRRELVLLGAVKDSGRKRKTSSGRNATVWIAVREEL